jgi:centromere protein C
MYVTVHPKSILAASLTKNAQVFYVIEGAIKLEVYDTDYILCTGSMFLVPRGMAYTCILHT